MAKQKSSILNHPRYWEYCARYHNNFSRFVCENSTQFPSWQQHDIMEALNVVDCKVAVASGHGTGKGWLMGWYSTWHLTIVDPRLAYNAYNGKLNPDVFSQMLLTANNVLQCRIGVWKYLDGPLAQIENNFPFLAGHFVKTTQRFYNKDFKDNWFVMAKTASKHKPEGVAGQHAMQFTLLVDEASGVEDVIHDVMEGALTQGGRHILISQPTRSTGRFADAFGTLKSLYKTFNLNAEESPFVTRGWVEAQLIKYGGHHSPEYQIKVLGRLPDNLAGYLIPRSWLEESQHLKFVTAQEYDRLSEESKKSGYYTYHKEAWGWLVTVDVAEGVHRDSSVYAVWKVSGYGSTRQAECIKQVEFLDRDEMRFTREMRLDTMDLPNVTYAVDADGPGRTVVLMLEEEGATVERIHWGLPCHMDADKKRYKNQRAFASVQTREGIFHHRMRLPSGKKVVEQGSRIPYKIDERGAYVIVPKDQMKSEGIKSPDLFDTVCFVWLSDFTPVSMEVDTEQNELLEMAKRLLMGEAA